MWLAGNQRWDVEPTVKRAILVTELAKTGGGRPCPYGVVRLVGLPRRGWRRRPIEGEGGPVDAPSLASGRRTVGEHVS